MKQFEQIMGQARKGGVEIGRDQCDLLIDNPFVRKPSGVSGSKSVFTSGQALLNSVTVFKNSAGSIFICSASPSSVSDSRGGTRVLTVAFQL